MVEVLLMVSTKGELLAETPAASVTLAVNVCEPFASEAVLRLKDQLLVPDALEKLPPSTATCTAVRATESEAVPETLIVPETVEPLAGEVIATVGTGELI